jgi:carboxylesterase 2
MLSNAMNRRTFLNGSLTVAATAVLVGTGTSADAADRTTSVTPLTGPLRIDTGRVSGVASLVSGVTLFKGLPYAATTAGTSRPRPPGVHIALFRSLLHTGHLVRQRKMVQL